VYVILLTARGRSEDVVEGLESGADDYVTKPFDWEELETRMRAGTRILDLQSELAHKVEEFKSALAHVRSAQGLLPIACTARGFGMTPILASAGHPSRVIPTRCSRTRCVRSVWRRITPGTRGSESGLTALGEQEISIPASAM
jgi:DNA-binding response OmpR family regulator